MQCLNFRSIIYSVIIILLMSAFSACQKDDEPVKKTPDQTAAADSVRVHPGLNRIALSWRVKDSTVRKAVVYCNNGDSIAVPYDGSGIMSAVFTGIKEGNYSFSIFLYDSRKHVSSPAKIVARVYGDRYIQSLSSREIQDVIYDKDAVIIAWDKPGQDMLGTEISYLNVSGDTQYLFVQPDMDSVVLHHYKPGIDFKYRTMYKPVPGAIDTFYAAYVSSDKWWKAVSGTLYLADPTIFFDKGTYYLYGTHTVNKGFEVYASVDLKHWKKQKQPALSKGDVYGDQGFWAPQVFKYKNKYYMAYTADEHIAIAESDSPLGPFKQKVKKAMTDPDGLKNIDPYVLIDDDGKKYLYYVRLLDGNRIFMAELKDDFSDIKPNTVTSCVNAVDHPQEWENLADKTWTVTEGPTVLKHDGKYYLFYSGDGFKSIYYAVGYAVADNPVGPWVKYAGNPILNKDVIGENGPGHGDFFQDKNGQFYYVFHTHFSRSEINPRRAALIRGDFMPGNKGETDKMKFDKHSFYYLMTK